MLKLILIRHGQYLGARPGVYYGWSDPPLNEEGRFQAIKLARKLADTPLTAIYSSPLKRAMETACIIALPHDIDPIEDKDLMELNFGQWEGKTSVEIEKEYPKEWQAWCDDWKNFVIPGGESAQDLYKRITHRLDKIVEYYKDGETIALVSHEGCIRAAACSLLGLGLEAYWRFKMKPAGIAEIEITDGFPVLARWG